MASVSYDSNCHLISYETYMQIKSIIAKNIMPAYISNIRQKMVSSISHYVLNQRSEALNRLTPFSLSWKPNALIWYSISVSEISSRTSLSNFAEAYFDSIQKNARRK